MARGADRRAAHRRRSPSRASGAWPRPRTLGRYRDALGIPPPPGTPPAFLEPVRDPLGDLVSRYARTHGPFPAQEAARRLGSRIGRGHRGPRAPGRRRARGRGRVPAGPLRARVVRRRRAARAPPALAGAASARGGAGRGGPRSARLTADWQGVGSSRRGRHALVEVIGQLQDAALPASALESEMLPARLARYDPADLDVLTAAGARRVGGRRRARAARRAGATVSSPSAPRTSCHGGRRRRRRAISPSASGSISRHARRLLLPADLHGVGPRGPARIRARPGRGHLGPGLGGRCHQRHDPAPSRAGAVARRGATAGPDAARAPSGGAGAARPASRRRGRPWLAGRGEPGAGRCVRALPPGRGASVTESLAARARLLLERHGVLTREAVRAEGVDGRLRRQSTRCSGPWRRPAACGAATSSRDAGRAQFALPGAVERLRALRDPGNRRGRAPRRDRSRQSLRRRPALAGAPEGRRPMRAAGALVILVDGALAAWIGARRAPAPHLPRHRGRRDAADVARAVAQTARPRGGDHGPPARHRRGGRPSRGRHADGRPAGRRRLPGHPDGYRR